MSNPELRLAHARGHTDLCYGNNGRFIITSGSNGEVCAWKGVDDDQPLRYKIGQQTYAVAFEAGRFFVANDSNSVQAYTFPDGDNDGIVTRFTSPVNHICVSDDAEILVSGSSDFMIKVVTLKDNLCLGSVSHDAPILSVSIDSSCKYLASTSCDGSARVWKIDEEISCVQKWNFLPVSSDYTLSETLGRLCWMPKTGKQLVIPVEKQLKVFVRDSWDHESTFTHPDIDQIISIAAFHPDGTFLAASCIDGKIYIWNFLSNDLFYRHDHKSKSTICGLVWNPKCNMELAYTDQLGYLGVFTAKLGSETKSTESIEDRTYKSSDLFTQSDDDNEVEDQLSLNGDFPGTDKVDHLTINENVDDDDEDISISRPFRPSILDDDNSNEFDIGAIKAKLEPEILGLNVQPSDINQEKKENVIIRYTGPELSKPQVAFQSGSTPVSYSHRYMKWNSVGIIHSYNTDEEHSIDVEFHDTATHHSLHFVNALNHILGDVSEQAVVFACAKDEDDPDSVSKLVCNHFSSWDDNQEWIVDMNKTEEFLSICVGKDWIAGATNFRAIRLFTIGGMQRLVLSIPGDIVTVAGHQNLLAIVYHKSIAIAGDQNLAMAVHVVGAETQKLSMPFDVPLSPKAEISWLGFSDEGSPCLIDSHGILRLLNGKTGHLWTQVMDTKDHAKGKSDHYFVIGVSESRQELRCIFCKGARYPATAPRPSVVILPLKIPLCEISTEKSKLEENYLKQKLLSTSAESFFGSNMDCEQPEVDTISKLEKENLMKLFALSCQANREFRASEVAAMMMPSQHLLQLAIKYATRTSRISLAEKIGEIAENAICGNMNSAPHEYFNKVDDASNHFENGRHEVDDNEVKEDVEDGHSEDDAVEEMNPLLNSQSANHNELISTSFRSSPSAIKKNPFKMQADGEKNEIVQSPGISAFDSMKKPKVSGRKLGDKADCLVVNNKINRKGMSKKKVASFIQSGTNMTTDQKTSSEPPKSGFQAWFEKNKSELAKENPDTDDLSLTKKAIKIFKSLSQGEKQKWNDPKPKTVAQPNDLKRKLENEPRSDAKASKQTCHQKLTDFMFKK